MPPAPHTIIIFASGNGSNAEKIIQHFKNSSEVNIAAVMTDNSQVGVIGRAEKEGIKTIIFSKKDLSGAVCHQLKEIKPSLIVLAGFLLLIPKEIITAFPDKIINIHPALLPKFGGKGMYGVHVHEAVANAGENESGITVHYVNEKFDEGEIIFQKSCELSPSDTPAAIALKVQQLEHEYYPKVIEELLKNQ